MPTGHQRLFPPLVRNMQAGRLLEMFLISAVVSLVVLRLLLRVTGFPQVGGHQLHIAHMLWGGLLMLSALMVLLTYLNAGANRLAAILGGAGFGIFIDELGKFITRDNNYFYQPSIALIYLIFIAIFLFYRWVDQRAHFRRVEYVVNAMSLLEESTVVHLDTEQESLLQSSLAKAEGHPFTPELQKLARQLRASRVAPPSLIDRGRELVEELIQTGINRGWLTAVTIVYFVAQSIAGVGLAALALYDWATRTPLQYPTIYNAHSFYTWGYIVSLLLATSCFVWGSMLLTYRPARAWQWYRRGLLVTIFVVEFFAFYREQLSAMFGLGWYVLLYIVVTTSGHGRRAVVETAPQAV